MVTFVAGERTYSALSTSGVFVDDGAGLRLMG